MKMLIVKNVMTAITCGSALVKKEDLFILHIFNEGKTNQFSQFDHLICSELCLNHYPINQRIIMAISNSQFRFIISILIEISDFPNQKRKKMSSKSTNKSKDKKISNELKSDKSIDKLIKKKKSVADEKSSAEKKLKKLKKEKGKKSKLKKLKELLTKLLKKEKKVAAKLKESKKNKKIIKDLKKGKKIKLSDKKKKEEKSPKNFIDMHATEVDQHAERAASTEQAPDQGPAQSANNSSVDHLAKEAIALVRKLNTEQDIDLFVLGDTRDTVIKAAQSRKNRLAKQ
jgi:hypothetical protein